MKKTVSALAATLGVLCGSCCPGNPRATAETFSLCNVYGDHMVLQRDVPIRIAGTANPGSTVKVTMTAEQNAVGEATSAFAAASANGEWTARLPARKAGGPYRLTVSGATGSTPVEFADVLVGDVWFCSGQSNMEMPVWGTSKLYREENGDRIAQQANDSQLRLFKVGKGIVYEGPKRNLPGGGEWQVATAAGPVEKFSATGYFFGAALRKELGVPVGLIDASWGGSMIQPWIPGAAYRKAGRPEIAQILEAQKEVNTDNLLAVKKLSVKDWLLLAEKEAAPDLAKRVKTWTQILVSADDWQSVSSKNLFLINYLGSAWFRAEFELPPKFDVHNALLHVGAIDDCDDTFVNGIKVGSTGLDTKDYWEAPRNYAIPAGLLHPGKNVVTFRVMNVNASGGIDGEVELFGPQKLNLRENARWSFRRGFVAGQKLCAKNPNQSSSLAPAVLFNAMIAPFTAFPIKGVLWYQGCANAEQPEAYLPLQKIWIAGWREAWKQPELPFVITQLAGYVKGREKPFTDAELASRSPAQRPGLAPLRDAQKAMLCDRIGVAVTIDLGCASDIHPHNKKDFAPRLLAEALRVAYGRKEILHSPLFSSMQREGKMLRVNFRPPVSHLCTKDGQNPRGFAVRGRNQKGEMETVWADAKMDGRSILLSAPGIKDPVEVLFAWEDYPHRFNLYDAAGLPVFPFRAEVRQK